jgi:hypothetical protein
MDVTIYDMNGHTPIVAEHHERMRKLEGNRMDRCNIKHEYREGSSCCVPMCSICGIMTHSLPVSCHRKNISNREFAGFVMFPDHT